MAWTCVIQYISKPDVDTERYSQPSLMIRLIGAWRADTTASNARIPPLLQSTSVKPLIFVLPVGIPGLFWFCCYAIFSDLEAATSSRPGRSSRPPRRSSETLAAFSWASRSARSSYTYTASNTDGGTIVMTHGRRWVWGRERSC